MLDTLSADESSAFARMALKAPHLAESCLRHGLLFNGKAVAATRERSRLVLRGYGDDVDDDDIDVPAAPASGVLTTSASAPRSVERIAPVTPPPTVDADAELHERIFGQPPEAPVTRTAPAAAADDGLGDILAKLTSDTPAHHRAGTVPRGTTDDLSDIDDTLRASLHG